MQTLSSLHNNTEDKEASMIILANVLIALVAALHLYFLILEMFFWDKPLGRKAFGLTPEFATASKALAV